MDPASSRRMFAAFGVILAGIYIMNRIVPESFMPKEDQGCTSLWA